MPLDLELTPTKDDVEKEPVTVESAAPTNSAFQVFLDADEDPQNMTSFRKWSIMLIVGVSCMCGTCLSAVVRERFIHSPSFFFYALFVLAALHECTGHGEIRSHTDRRHPCTYPVLSWPGNRSSSHRTVIGGLWAKHHISRFIRSAFRFLVACRIRT